jgi:hypothetical protein
MRADRTGQGNDRGCQDSDDRENNQHFDQREANMPSVDKSHGNYSRLPFAWELEFEFRFLDEVSSDGFVVRDLPTTIVPGTS